MKKYTTVNEYIKAQPTLAKNSLKEIRSIIRSVAPDAEEMISYMIPCYKYHGSYLVGFGAYKNGCSFYPMNAGLLKIFSKELEGFDCLKGTIHLDNMKKLPVSLIKKMIRQRMKENKEKELLKKLKTKK